VSCTSYASRASCDAPGSQTPDLCAVTRYASSLGVTAHKVIHTAILKSMVDIMLFVYLPSHRVCPMGWPALACTGTWLHCRALT
jgi:hypothetical protein